MATPRPAILLPKTFPAHGRTPARCCDSGRVQVSVGSSSLSGAPANVARADATAGPA